MGKSTFTDNYGENPKKKRAALKKELYASEIRYRRLFESAKDGILILDAETGKIVDVNPFLIDLLGYSKQEFIEKSIWEIGAFHDIIENKEKFLELQQSEYVRYEDLPLETSDGNKIYVEFVSNVYLVENQKVIQCSIRDITTRKETEAVLEKTGKDLAEIKKTADELNEFTENIIDTVREPLLAIDKDLRVIKASRSFYKFFKVTTEETIGKLIYELGNHQWNIPKLKELLEKIIPEKNTFDNYEVEHNFSTIGKRVMLLNARQVKRAFGKEQIILLAIEDITERKDKEDSLKETHRATSEFLNIILNHLHTPIIVWDTSMIIKRFNRQFELLSGYNLAEVIDKKIDFLFPKEKIAATLELLKNHLDDKLEVVEIDILTKDNTIKTVLWNSSRILDEEGKKIVATISQDITSRKRTEDALNLLETRYRRLFESAKDGILILDAKTGKIIDVNPFLIDLLGYSKKEFIEKSIWEIGAFQDVIENKEKFLELQQKEYVRYEDLPLETATGRMINVEFVGSVYFVNQSKVIQCNVRDITERKKVEELLQETEERYKSFFENSIDAILITNSDGRILSANPAACKMFGYSEKEFFELRRFGLADMTDPRITDLISERSLNKKAHGEVTFIRKDGVRFPGETSSAVFKNLNGLEYTSLIIRDITERKMAEEKLQKSEERFRTAAETITDVVYEWDIKQKLDWYGDIDGITEYPPGEFPRTIEGWIATVHPEDKERVKAALEDHLKGLAAYAIEYRVRKKSSEWRWWSARGTALRNERGEPYRMIGSITDISERKKIENEIKFQADLINNVGQAVIATDLTGKVIYWNNAAEKIYGWSTSEAIGQNIMDLTPAQQYNELAIDIMEKLSEGKIWAGEFFVKRKDGSSFPAFVTDTPMLDSNGKLTGIIGISSNITERKLAEIELINAKLKAEESDRLKSAFLANMSHEIRTPMNGILGFTNLLLEPDLSSEQKESFIEIVHQSGQRMLNTVNDIVEISKIEAGLAQLNLKETDVNGRMDELFSFFQPEADKKGIKLSMKKLPKWDKNIITDQNKLDSILTNLIKNAIKYSQVGEIRVGCIMQENMLEFYVKDTGIGIPKNRQQAIFNRFEQADIEDTRVFEGSGLGLSIAKAYVEMLGGKIWLESQEEKGSTFYFTLPLSGKVQGKRMQKEIRKQDKKTSQIKNLDIIIAEDDENSALFLQTILKKESNKILVTKNGHETVEACRNNPDTDLVLMDIQMPEMNGYDATREIRKFNKKVIIIAQTAFALAGDQEKAMDAGCNDYIAKPINKKVLLHKIDKHTC